MEHTFYGIFLAMLETANLEYATTFYNDQYFIASSDKDNGSIVISVFNLDGMLMNIYADDTINSTDQFLNEKRYS